NFAVNVVPPTVTITASDPVVVEVVGAAGTTDGQFTVTRSGGLAADLMVRVQVSGTVTVPNDYYPIPDNMYIPAGSFSGTIPVYPFADYEYEPTETLNIQILSDPAYSTAVPVSATVIFYSWANLVPLSGDTTSACTSINEVPRVV